MKKSVKILIVVLCLIIVGLVTFIVVDKVININKKEETKVEENNAIAAENNINNAEVNNTENNSTKTESSQNKDNVSSTNKSEPPATSINNTENNSTKNDSSPNNVSHLNGTYERPDESERTIGKLIITNTNTDSFYFEIDATRYNGRTVESSIANGTVSMGGVSGTAKKVSDDTYEFIPNDDDELMESFEGDYKIIFTLNDNKSIKIEEIYNENIHEQGPYSGWNVWFNGVYKLVTKEK